MVATRLRIPNETRLSPARASRSCSAGTPNLDAGRPPSRPSILAALGPAYFLAGGLGEGEVRREDLPRLGYTRRGYRDAHSRKRCKRVGMRLEKVGVNLTADPPRPTGPFASLSIYSATFRKVSNARQKRARRAAQNCTPFEPVRAAPRFKNTLLRVRAKRAAGCMVPRGGNARHQCQPCAGDDHSPQADALHPPPTQPR